MNINALQEGEMEKERKIWRRIAKGMSIALLSTMAFAIPLAHDIEEKTNLKKRPEYQTFERLNDQHHQLQRDAQLLEKILSTSLIELSQKDVILSLNENYNKTKKKITSLDAEKYVFLRINDDFRDSYYKTQILDTQVLISSMLSLTGMIYGLRECIEGSKIRRATKRKIQNQRTAHDDLIDYF